MLALLASKLAALEAFLAAHHLQNLVFALRTYALDPRIYFAGLAPALVLERVFPLGKRRPLSQNLLVDFSFPILDGAILGGAINGLGMLTAAALTRDARLPWDYRLLDGAPLWIQALGAYLTASLCAYVAHRLLHKIPWLWHFHAVHHSQTVLNPFTTRRAHVVEDLFTLAIAAIPIGVVGGSYPTWLWIPVLNGFWSYVIHADAKTNLGPLRWIVVSPQMHRIHHSTDKRHFEKNFCTELALWDYLFGTAYERHDEYPAETGVVGFEIADGGRGPVAVLKTWARLNAYPFVAIARSIRARVATARAAREAV